MKKIVSVILVILIVSSSAFVAFATEPNNPNEDLYGRRDLQLKGHERSERRNGFAMYEVMQEFNDEFHELNMIEIEMLNLKIQIVEKKDILLDVHPEFGEDGPNEEIRQIREQITEVNKEIFELRKEADKERKSFRDEIEAGDIEEARENINEVINLRYDINDKMKEKIELFNQLIDIF